MAPSCLGPAQLGERGRKAGRVERPLQRWGKGEGASVVPWSHGLAQVQGRKGGVAARPLGCLTSHTPRGCHRRVLYWITAGRVTTPSGSPICPPKTKSEGG